MTTRPTIPRNTPKALHRYLLDLEIRADELARENQALRAMCYLCDPDNREVDYSIIPGPDARDTEHGRGIFMLSTTGASQVARLLPGDVLIIGRNRKAT
jgi:hypothetical protein